MSEFLIGLISIAVTYIAVTGIGYLWLRCYGRLPLAVRFFELETFGCGLMAIAFIAGAIAVSYAAGLLIKTLSL